MGKKDTKIKILLDLASARKVLTIYRAKKQEGESVLWKKNQPALTCSKLKIETLEQGLKYVQS